MIKETLRSCLAAAAFASGSLFAETAVAGPISDLGTKVIIDASLRDFFYCCEDPVSNRVATERSVRFPPEPELEWYPTGRDYVGGGASLSGGALRAYVGVPLHPTRNSTGRAQVSASERVTLRVPANGPSTDETIKFRYDVGGTIESPASARKAADFAVRASFTLSPAQSEGGNTTLTSPSQSVPDNTNAPIPDLISYSHEIVEKLRFGRSERTTFLPSIGRGTPFVSGASDGLGKVVFGFEAELPVIDLLRVLGESRQAEIKASLDLEATVDRDAGIGAQTTRLNFSDTAVITVELPPGYDFISESGFLSAKASSPELPSTPVPEPASALLLLGGIAGLAAARRRR